MSALTDWLANNPEHRQHVQFCPLCAEAELPDLIAEVAAADTTGPPPSAPPAEVGRYLDEPLVCIAHGRFLPCRKQGEHRTTANPYWVKAVRDYHGSPIDDLSWEPAWTTTTEEGTT